MDFAKGKILAVRLRQIAFATGLGSRSSLGGRISAQAPRSLACDKQPPKPCAAADEVEALAKISPLAKSISGPPPLVYGYDFI